MAENHVDWLRRQAAALRLSSTRALEAGDEKKAKARAATADRMAKVATTLEMALAGADVEAMGGHAGLIKRLRPGTRVRVQLVNQMRMTGMIRAFGRYDFALLADDLREYVVPKHAVVFWELVGDEELEALTFGLKVGPNGIEVEEIREEWKQAGLT